MERHFDTPSPIAQSWFDEHVVIVDDSDDFIIGSARTTITQMRPMTADDPANTNHIAVPECSENHEEDYFPFDFTTTTTDFVTNSFAHGGNQCNDNHNKVMSMMFDVNNFSHFIDSDPTVEVMIILLWIRVTMVASGTEPTILNGLKMSLWMATRAGTESNSNSFM